MAAKIAQTQSNGKQMSDYVSEASWYRLTAAAYIESAKVLAQSFEARGQCISGNRLAAPYYFLVSHAIELLLKCALLKRGVAPSELKKFGVGHNYAALLERLLALGVPVSDHSKSLLALLNDQHGKHVLRYTVFYDDGDPTYTPEPIELYNLLDELLLAGRIASHGI